MNLTTEADLAEEWGIPLPKFAELRRQRGWPHVRISRFDVRYTDAQVEAIVEMQTKRPERTTTPQAGRLPGQTARSARRRSA